MKRRWFATVVAVITLASAGCASSDATSAAAVSSGRGGRRSKIPRLFHNNPQSTCLYDPASGCFLEVTRRTDKYGYTREEFWSHDQFSTCVSTSSRSASRRTRGFFLEFPTRSGGSERKMAPSLMCSQFRRPSSRWKQRPAGRYPGHHGSSPLGKVAVGPVPHRRGFHHLA